MKNFFEKNGLTFYAVFRILIGLMFIQHGVSKLFGMLGANAAQPLFSLMWFAGVIEFIAGIAIVVGFFTRPAAILAALDMIVAYFKVHASQGFYPIMNNGELAVVFFAAFLAIMAYGAGKWSLEKYLMKDELL